MAKHSIQALSLFLVATFLFLPCLALPISGQANDLSASVAYLPGDLPLSSLGRSATTGATREVLKPTSSSNYKSLKVYAGGIPFGVKFLTAGVLIIGFCEISGETGTQNPARCAGLLPGDRLLSINETPLTSAAELTELIDASAGKPLQIRYARGGAERTATLTPIWSAKENRYSTGVYVRDSGAGIGTVTFVIPKTCAFAGLGHGICDGETGELIPMDRGSVVDVTIHGVVRGLAGSPGEVRGYFNTGKTGSLLGNSHCGVWGVYADLPKNLNTTPISVGLRDELKAGKATILCTVEGNTCREYDIEISDIRRDSTSNKCFTVKVTDKDLLAKTGGIIQGMSGSPILQNGKLVGAVTHVLINDPTTGYGIFIENMLAQMGDLAA